MARRSRRKRSRSRKTRRTQKARTRRVSYRHGLQEAIGKWLPGQFFSHWPVVAGSKWSPQRLFWLAILMTWSAEQTLQSRFAASRDVVRALFPKWPLGKSYTGWYEAQLQWLVPLRSALSRRLRQQMQGMAGRYWQREGWCAFAVDGSRVECPRTRANEQGLGCAGRKKTGPQLFLTTLYHVGTGLPWDFRIGPGTASERRHLEAMLPQLPPRALVIADAGFAGYDFYRRILAVDQHFLLRVGANVHLLKELGYCEQEGRDTVYVWPDQQRQQQPVVLRLIRLQRGNKRMYLVTSVLDRKALSDRIAAVFYEMRWGVEVFYRSLKETLEKRKMLSRTPQSAECELTWAVFGLWLLGLTSVAKIIARGADPLRWSVASARDRARQSMRRALSRRHQDLALVHDMSWALKDDYVRQGSKKARDWPHKKTEAPPGTPKIRLATTEQRIAAQRLKAKKTAA